MTAGKTPITVNQTTILNVIFESITPIRNHRLRSYIYILDQVLRGEESITLYNWSDMEAIGTDIESSQFDSDIKHLIDGGYINVVSTTTLGGGERISYSLTESGRKTLRKSRSKHESDFDELEDLIESIISTYTAVPISNLLHVVVESELDDYQPMSHPNHWGI